MEQVFRLNNKIYEDEWTGVSHDNYASILAIVMVLVHLCYRCYYCQLGNDDKEEHIVFNGTCLYRLINKIYEDECTGVSRDNYVGILAIVMVLVHLCYSSY